jgi:hypothetical protein
MTIVTLANVYSLTTTMQRNVFVQNYEWQSISDASIVYQFKYVINMQTFFGPDCSNIILHCEALSTCFSYRLHHCHALQNGCHRRYVKTTYIKEFLNAEGDTPIHIHKFLKNVYRDLTGESIF